MPIIKDYRTPRGRFEPDVPRIGALLLAIKPIGAAGILPAGETWLTLNKHRVAVERPEVIKPSPIIMSVTCKGPACFVVFETTNPRRIYHAKPCLWAASRSRRPSRARPRLERVAPVSLCGHLDRPVIALGQCRPCYNARWRQQKKLPI